jgi:FKBP-type peptidyl-prolyl cis-trans isomerase 2
MQIKKGDTVTIHYKRSLPDGTLIDAAGHVDELCFRVGEQAVLPGLDRIVEGMSLGQEKDVCVRAEEAYGRFNQDLVRKIPQDLLPGRFVPELGMMLSLQNQEGKTLAGIIREINAKHIVLDLNHPLVDKDIHVHIKIKNIER